MNIARFSVHRPIFVTMVMLIVMLLGGVSLQRIPIDLMPDITYPTLSISTTYENAAPAEVEELITKPIEQVVNAIPGVQEITSTSTEGSSNIRLTFAWGVDLDSASNDIRDRLDRIVSRLPENAARPTLRKFDLSGYPILIMGAASPSMDSLSLRNFLEDKIKYRIERIPGVASFDIMGGDVREIQVSLYMGKIESLHLPLDQIVAKIKAQNITLPTGNIERGNIEVTVRIPGQFASVRELGETIVAVRDGVPILLKTIARIEDTKKKQTQLVRINGVPGIRLAVSKQSGTNTVEVANLALKEFEKINQEISHIKITPIINSSTYIQRSISNTMGSVVQGGILAILVLLFFLGNFRSTLVIAISIPFSLIATFSLIYFAGFTLNLMSLGGLALGVGMLVDNSIVVLENIFRLRKLGMDAKEAAEKGTNELGAALVASTLTTVIVFLPLIFVRGMSGIMFKQLAYIVTFSLICSLVVALTVVPMLAARMIKIEEATNAPQSAGAWLIAWVQRGLEAMERGYQAVLRIALAHAWTVSLIVVASLLASLLLLPGIGVEFMPTTDEGEVRINVNMEAGIQLKKMLATLETLEKKIKQYVPETVNVESRVGGGGGGKNMGSRNAGQIRIILTPRSQRKRSNEQVAAALRRQIGQLPGVVIRVRASGGVSMMRGGGGGQDEKIQLEIRGHDLMASQRFAETLEKIVEDVPGVTDAVISRDEKTMTPEDVLIIDRQKAGDLKLTVSQIANMLQTVLGGTMAGNYREGGKEFGILVKFRESEKMALKDVMNLTLQNSEGESIALANVIQIKSTRSPMSIERKNQQRIITLAVNISERDTGSVIEDIQTQLRNIAIPPDISVHFAGDYEEQVKAYRELMLSLLLALIMVYMVMACQYESLRDPFVVMFSVPLAIIGVLVMLFATKTTFNLQSFIGCIMLGGIVVNNAILLVDQANQLRQEGMEIQAALIESGVRRIRSILMTSLTTILGLIPMALGWGEGGEAQAPLARVVIGGLFTSTFITLVFVPIIYLLFYEWRQRRETQNA